MAERKPDLLRETPLTWEHDPYGGVDITMIKERLKMTPEERLRVAVRESNTLRRFMADLRK